MAPARGRACNAGPIPSLSQDPVQKLAAMTGNSSGRELHAILPRHRGGGSVIDVADSDSDDCAIVNSTTVDAPQPLAGEPPSACGNDNHTLRTDTPAHPDTEPAPAPSAAVAGGAGKRLREPEGSDPAGPAETSITPKAPAATRGAAGGTGESAAQHGERAVDPSGGANVACSSEMTPCGNSAASHRCFS